MIHNNSPNKQDICGPVNISNIVINGHKCKALIDTGSVVSTVSKSFYSNLRNVPLLPLDNLLEIEAATGDMLPYDGYIEGFIQIPDLANFDVTALLLVVPDTMFNRKVPVLIGTNLLMPLKDKSRDSPVKSNGHNSWNMAFKCLALQERQIQRNSGRLALIKSANSNKILIPSNHTMSIPGYVDKKISLNNCYAVIQPTEKSSLPDNVEIVPAFVDYGCDLDKNLTVVITNHNSYPIVVNSRSILGELQWCTPTLVQSQQNVRFNVQTNDNDVVTDDAFLSGFNFSETNLTSEQLFRLQTFLSNNKDAFSLNDQNLGFTNMVRHKILLNDETPFKQRHRTIPPGMYEELRAHLRNLLDMNVIRKSHSPWCSNVVLARKKDQSLRLCIDYRQLNQRTIKDSYALPRIEETLDCLAGSKFFSVLDMKSSYYQVEVEENHKQYTAFSVGSLGLFEYNRMPFGLTNSPATYQRLMEECFDSLNHKECVIFLDDIVVFFKAFDEHVERLNHVIKKIRESGMLLSRTKCHFCRHKANYLGHVISEQGVETDPSKTEKIKTWPRPRNVDELRKFLGFSGYYRRFVKDYSKIAAPLYKLLGESRTEQNVKDQN